jgi:histidine phosphotransfer protein HptB
VSETPLTPAVFDRLRQATAKDPNVLAELCRDYLTEARSALSQMNEAFRSKDGLLLRNRAHYLKGSSMVIGANVLSQCCATLERMGRDSDFAATEQMLEQAETALADVELELTKQVGPAVVPAEGSAA